MTHTIESSTPLPALIIEPEQTATASVIWLHGLGADGYDFEPIVPQLGLAQAPVRFIFPHAPERPITLNNGYVMRGWYDIRSLDAINRQEDAAGTRDSEQQLVELIRAERDKGIAAERIILAGFSQGGAMVLHTGLRYTERLGGIMALSCYLPLVEQFDDERHGANADTPIFMAHGQQDPVVAYAYGLQSRQHLESFGYKIQWHDYPMQHSLCAEEIEDIAAWLKSCLEL